MVAAQEAPLTTGREGTPNVGGRSLWENFFRPADSEDLLYSQLERVFIFQDLGGRDLRLIRDMMHERSYGADEVVFFEGQPGSGMYIIIEGQVRIVLNYGRENEIELARLGAGDFFGEFSLIDEAPRSATVVTGERTRLGGFFRPNLLDLINRKPQQGVQIVLNLSEVLTERLRRTNAELRSARIELDRLRDQAAATDHE